MLAGTIVRKIQGSIVALFFLAQLFVFLLWALESVSPLAENPDHSYDVKMHAKLGKYYELVQFIQKETPPDAILLFDSPSHIDTNLYFLYPRRVLYDRELTARAVSADYVVITGDAPPPSIEGERFMLDAERGLIRLK